MVQATAATGFAAAFGGTDPDRSFSVQADSLGNVYTTGTFEGTADFDPSSVALDLVSAGGTDIFVTKLDASGDLSWAVTFGSTGADQGVDIFVDGSDNVYVTGSFEGTVDFDPGGGTTDLISGGAGDTFIVKLDSAGALLWARSVGGTGADEGLDVVVDGTGNVFTTGTFEVTVDFDPGAGTANLTSAGNSDIFILKLDASGILVWARNQGGTGADVSTGIAVGASGDVFTTGNFSGTADFDPGGGVFNLTNLSGSMFASKLDASGSLLWASAFGGAGTDQALSVALDMSDNAYVTGSFEGTADFDPGLGVTNLVSSGGTDVFLLKLDTSGISLWARAMGGTDADVSRDVFASPSGDVYATGVFEGTSTFDAGSGMAELISVGGTDVFVTKLTSSGDLDWAQALGGTDADEAQGIFVDALGNVYTAGSFEGTADFNPGAGTLELTSAGLTDAFVSRLNAGGFVTLLGDVNEDDVVDATDALWMIQFEFGLRADLTNETADLNGDGNIDSTDALWAIQIENALRPQP
jgi:hypothetical protein